MYTVQETIDEVKITQKIEGITVSNETEKIIRECLEGKKSFSLAREEVISYFKKKYGSDK